MKKQMETKEIVPSNETIQAYMNVADGLRKEKKHKEAIKHYLIALELAKKDWEEGIKVTLWQKKVIFMACNGMGISYSGLGKPTDAIENFVEAMEYAPTLEARRIAVGNLRKYEEAYYKATGSLIIPL